MRVLLLNWRDIRSPRAGGAEVLTHEIARRLVARGDEVTWFTARPPGLPERESIDGIEIVRRGSELTTRLHAPAFARSRAWDVVVEEINTLPWFAPLWSRAPVVLLIYQLAREVWWYESPRPLAPLGWLSEPAYLQAYRSCPAVTISASTRDDLRRLGVGRPVTVIPVAVSVEPLEALPPKRPTGRLVSVSRLVPSKRPADAVEALTELRRELPQATLTLIGDGPQRAALAALIRARGLEDAVRLAGRVGEDEKRRLLAESDLLVACPAREGWGLTVTEAALLGTPAVAYDVPGLRDSIIDGRTGVLTAQEPAALARAAASLIADRARYDRLREAGWRLWSELSFERSASAFAAAVEDALAR